MFDDLLPPPITQADPNAFENLRASVSRALRIRHFLALDLAEHISQLLRERRKSRRWLAQRLGKTDSELSKWLSGTHNLTLDSIAKLSDALEVDLLVSPRFPTGYFGNVAANAPARATVTNSGSDWSVGSLAHQPERISPREPANPQPPARQKLPEFLQDQGFNVVLNAGDYGYAMAA